MTNEARKYFCYATTDTLAYRINKEDFQKLFILGNSEIAKHFRSSAEIREAFFFKSIKDTEKVYEDVKLEIQKEEDKFPLKKLRRIINSEKFKRKFLSHYYFGNLNQRKRSKCFFKRKVKLFFSNFFNFLKVPASQKMMRMMTLEDREIIGKKEGIDIFRRNIDTKESYYLLDEMMKESFKSSSVNIRRDKRRGTLSVVDLGKLEIEEKSKRLKSFINLDNVEDQSKNDKKNLKKLSKITEN